LQPGEVLNSGFLKVHPVSTVHRGERLVRNEGPSSAQKLMLKG